MRATALCALVALVGGVASAAPAKRAPAPKKEPPPKEAPPPPPPPEPEPEPAPKPRPLAGDTRRIIAILDVRVGEGVPPETAQQFQKDLDAKLDSKQYWLAPHMRVREMMTNSTKWTDGCLAGDCLHEVKAQTGADVVLLASLTGSGTSFASVITLVRTDNGRPVGQKIERCDVCTLHEALGTATESAVKLLSSLPDKLPDEVAEQKATLDAQRAPLDQQIATLDAAQHHRGLGAVLTLVGLAATVTGAVMYYGGSKSPSAAGVAGAGAGVLFGGVVVLTF